jgi:hypothetical protein
MRVMLAALLVAACGPRQSSAHCEESQAVYLHGNGSELLRITCAGDEQCLELGPKQAVCRLEEACSRTGQRECRGDALVRCNPQETFLERIDCVTQNHGKPRPGTCAPDALSGPDCVDRDAGRCTRGTFVETCNGDDRTVCRDGYTSFEAACDAARAAGGGTCRLNDGGSAVCAQAAGAACGGFTAPVCGGTDIVTCESGFVWREPCPPMQTCRNVITGDVLGPSCQ